MSYYDSSRARAHKREMEKKRTANDRDARDAGIRKMYEQRSTTTAETTSSSRTSAGGATSGSKGGYTAPNGRSGGSRNGGTSIPKATVRSGMSDYDIALRNDYNKSLSSIEQKKENYFQYQEDSTRAVSEPPKATFSSGMSDYDIQLRQDYNRQLALDAQQTAWGNIKDEGRKKDNWEKDLTEQRNQYMDMIDKADAGGYRISDHHLRDIRRQLDDVQAQIDMSDDRLAGYRADLEKANETYTGGTWATETKPMDLPQTGDQIDVRLGVIDLELASLKNQLNSSVEYEDIADLSREEYLAGSQKNLEKRQEAEARMLQLMWERERLSDQKNMASKGNSESISKQAETILYDGATEDALFRDYWFSQKDPTLERKSNFLTQEEQLHNFRDHNYETLYGDSIIPGPLRDYIHDLPGEYKHKAYECLGKGIGGLVSGRHPVFKDLGEMIADNIDTYNVAFGRSYRGFLLSGVDEETAKSAARDEAFVVTCLNGIGGVAEDLTEKMSEVFVKDAIPQYLIKKGIKAVKNLSDSAMEEIVAEENENRILSGDSDAGIGGLFERVIIRGLFFEGFNEE